MKFAAPGLVCLLLLLLTTFSSAQSTPSFAEGSAENDALTAAAPYSEKNPQFTLRQDYWRGDLTENKGTAFRLQFFKGNTYRMFFAIRKSDLPEGAILHLHVVDRKNRQLAHAASTPDENVVELSYKAKKTTQYLVLMRLALPDDITESTSFPGLMIYGWE